MKQYPYTSALKVSPLLDNKVFWISIITLILIATTFWTQSRVPALNQKAEVGTRVNLSAIAFDIIFPVTESQPLYERTWKSSVNWAYTNWKGMVFGFLLASAFITLLQSLPGTPAYRNRFLNSLLGLGIGSPLGVCVNCATPIAQGMIHAGVRLETSLATLMSSPTLNPIVLSIAFALLPFHLVLIKILLSVLFIILVVPLLVTLSGLSKSARTNPEEIDRRVKHFVPDSSAIVTTQTWPTAIWSTAILLSKNLLYIIKITLPLMLVAGFAGSLLIESLPSGHLSALDMNPLTLLAIAAIATFLPVPIAFDILIVNMLISAGLDIGLASTLLFSLGIFSIYPALIIGKTVSKKLSLLFFVSVMVFGIAAGVVTDTVDRDISHIARMSIDNALKGQEGRMSLTEAVDTCRVFGSPAGEQRCLNQFLLSGLFVNAGKADCTLDASVDDTSPDRFSAPDICRMILSYLKTRKTAIDRQDVHLCNTLSPTTLIDQCTIHYIRSRALEYSSLETCQQVSSPALQRYCRAALIAQRMPMKTEESCNLNLNSDMKRQCLDNLQAHITSEAGDIEQCETLVSENARSICRSTVVSLKISNFQDYAVCGELKDSREISTCKDKAIFHRSVQLKNPFLCDSLSNKARIDDCRISAMIRKKQAEIENRHFLSFNMQDSQHITLDTGSAETPTMKKTTKSLPWLKILGNEFISLDYIEHRPRDIRQGNIFRKISGVQLGLHMRSDFDLTDFMEPFTYGKGIASGDFNQDGWPDLAFASSNGILLYRNTGDGRFTLAHRINPEGQSLNAFAVAFVDIDNDNWQDLFVSAYGQGVYFFHNKNGHYLANAYVHLQEEDTIVTLSAAFSDQDKDGDLDIALGNWSYGAEGAFIPEKSQNIQYRNNGLKFTPSFPDEPPGETLSLLMSDINSDGYTDLVVGNDRKYPDIFYLGKPDGEFSRVSSDMNLIPGTSLNTMSYDSADFNNDLLLDIFSTDMFVASGGKQDYCGSLSEASDKERCRWLVKGSKALDSLDVGWCASLKDPARTECYTAMAIRLAKRDKNKSLCARVSSFFPAKAEFCRNISRKIQAPEFTPYDGHLAQHESNKLLINTPEGHFRDVTESMGVKNSFWGWTGKAADLDNDEWQDIYIGNGLGFGQHSRNIHSNIFYHNQGGQTFTQAEESFGLTNYANTPSYTYVDLDLDGDIDIVSADVMSTPSIFINQKTTGNSISFILRDKVGNRFCIGCKIIIRYDGGRKNQIRELKSGGGFLSYDAPIAYFGVADYDHIDKITIEWTTGEAWELDKPLPVNRRYKVTRHK